MIPITQGQWIQPRPLAKQHFFEGDSCLCRMFLTGEQHPPEQAMLFAVPVLARKCRRCEEKFQKLSWQQLRPIEKPVDLPAE